ncbi:hypothetical protein SLEP1_g34751 [Rubroshorea leprosula]|uniref:Uncharacterized protein n=1 Tax=Rubroshorea leprosula TaxID=152421 RepID=A0AAV5KL10_9ROSI|nr:hypothetical protein SLEP1_g34751 [Rubroshorea leprosula]
MDQEKETGKFAGGETVSSSGKRAPLIQQEDFSPFNQPNHNPCSFSARPNLATYQCPILADSSTSQALRIFDPLVHLPQTTRSFAPFSLPVRNQQKPRAPSSLTTNHQKPCAPGPSTASQQTLADCLPLPNSSLSKVKGREGKEDND